MMCILICYCPCESSNINSKNEVLEEFDRGIFENIVEKVITLCSDSCHDTL